MKKYEWRKMEKETYLPKNMPVIYKDNMKKYIMVSGAGSPDSETFQSLVELLYALSYSIRMLPKNGITPKGYYEYTVYPLEGIWDLDEEGRKMKVLDKHHFVYTLMIRQPDFVTVETFQQAVEAVAKKKKHLPVEIAELHHMSDGLCVQMMHIGSFSTETETFAVMEKFCQEKGLKRTSKIHREIYIGDPRRTEPEKLKTVLRFKVE
nr:GyrI-like domain-containing protein [uncultured Bacillus sp.]